MNNHSRLALLVSIGLLTLSACQRQEISLNPSTPSGPTPQQVFVTSTPERYATLSEATGTVEFRAAPDQPWAATSAGIVLNEGNQVRTGADGRARVLFTEGSKLDLTADTTVSFNIFSNFLDSKNTLLALDRGAVWVLLNSGRLDVETPAGRISALQAFLSVRYEPASQKLEITCLEGTCGIEQLQIPARFKYVQTGAQLAVPEPMQGVDYGQWARNVPEATQLAALEVAAVPPTETLTVEPTATPTTAATPTTSVAVATPSNATDIPTPTRVVAPTRTPISTATPLPRPTLPIMGEHRVLSGETVLCIARGYGVSPDAILEANNLTANSRLFANQRLGIPIVRWNNILPGPVCQPQFQSLFPGLPVSTEPPPATIPPEASATSEVPPTAAGPLTITEVAALCQTGCDSLSPTYTLLIVITVQGGVEPYTIQPGPGLTFSLTLNRCEGRTDTVTVTSADGQTVSRTWQHQDTYCSPTPTP
ncbi:MAG: FecR domain-containing protein [Anaerolineales bacterium]|nr:FecR domain-containing protein [Anaerolineales bacterium]